VDYFVRLIWGSQRIFNRGGIAPIAYMSTAYDELRRTD